MSKEEILTKSVDAVEYIKDHGIIAEFSAEDATRTEFDYLKEIYKAVEDAGARLHKCTGYGWSNGPNINEMAHNKP